jgi:ABC-2 type transport system permease protein
VRALIDIARKDATVIFRDHAAILVMLAMPMGLIFILGSALGGVESNPAINAKVAIVNLDEGETGELFVEGLTESPEIAELFRIEVTTDADAVRIAVEKGDLTAAMIIPADLTERMVAGEPASVDVLQDPGSRVTAGVWAGVVRAAVSHASAQVVVGRTVAEMLGPPAEGTGQPPAAGGATGVPLDAVTVRMVEAETQKRISMIAYYAADMTGMFLLFGAMFGAFAFLKERREQTVARILATPAPKVAIVGGKALGIALVGIGQFLVLLVGTTVLFRVDWGAAVVATVAIGIAEVLAAAGLAMTLTALGKTERAVGGLGPAIIIFFAATGGSMMPAEIMPAWMKPLQVVSPVYWAVDGFLDVMTGAGLTDVLVHIGVILVIAAVLFSFGLWRLRYQ